MYVQCPKLSKHCDLTQGDPPQSSSLWQVQRSQMPSALHAEMAGQSLELAQGRGSQRFSGVQ